jgi:hypothetical protein
VLVLLTASRIATHGANPVCLDDDFAKAREELVLINHQVGEADVGPVTPSQAAASEFYLAKAVEAGRHRRDLIANAVPPPLPLRDVGRLLL